LSIVRSVRPALAALAALALLTLSLTFYDTWPTPKVEWYGHLSVEVSAAVAVVLAATRRGVVPVRGLRALAAVWLALVLGRYVDVMAPSLYGRPINLYWDLRHMGAVFAMMTDAIAPPLVALGLAVVFGGLALGYVMACWAMGAVARLALRPAGWRVLAGAVAVTAALFAVDRWTGRPFAPLHFAPTVSATYWLQAQRVADQMWRPPIPQDAAPPLPGDLGGVRGADVLLVFLESYGAVTLDRPAVAGPVHASRARFAADVAATGRGVVSAMVDSPTFGGGSWLAHITLMTGIETRDEATNSALMRHRRHTLVSALAGAGYRTVALMPGLSHAWPEGAFYGFDRIYDTAALGYAGPRFGWWPVPDQFALARLDVLEAAEAARPPLFVFFPTTNTHAPFAPTPPYQPDWHRLVTPDPFEAGALAEALALEPDYFDLGPSYVRALSYTLATLGGYLRRHPSRDLVLVLVGDHQPAAAVAGEGASWDVPVHVVASRPAVLDALVAAGFRPGITPERRALGPMHALLPTLLTSFGTPAARVAARTAPRAEPRP
jgi:hypothetical protein